MPVLRNVFAGGLFLLITGCAAQNTDDSGASAQPDIASSRTGPGHQTPKPPPLPATITPTAYVTLPVDATVDEPPLLAWLRWQKVRVETDTDGDARIYDSATARHALVLYRRMLRLRMDTIAQNVANLNTTRDARGDLNPYRRKFVTIDDKGNVEIKPDPSPFRQVYEPSNPEADEKGIVKYPNVDLAVEYANAREASTEYDIVLRIMQHFDPTLVVGESNIQTPLLQQSSPDSDLKANLRISTSPR